jgi:hypothetical protein
MTTVAPAGGVNAVFVRLAALALAVDETIDQLEAWHLTAGEAELLGSPTLHLDLSLERLRQIIHEVGAIDQRPQLERLRAAA